MFHRAIIDLALAAFKLFCITAIFIAVTFTFFTLGPVLETRWFPVVSKLRILSLSADDDGYAHVRAEFTKLRNCEYIGLTWYEGSMEFGFERVRVTLMQDNANKLEGPTRPIGTQRAGPWIVEMTPEELMDNSFARLTHRCHALWVTTTDFYP